MFTNIVIIFFFCGRYAILTKETWPKWTGGDVKQGVVHILKFGKMNPEDYQLGKTKIFIKAPESVKKNIYF